MSKEKPQEIPNYESVEIESNGTKVSLISSTTNILELSNYALGIKSKLDKSQLNKIRRKLKYV